MPYIKLADRPIFDTIIDGTVAKIKPATRNEMVEVLTCLSFHLTCGCIPGDFKVDKRVISILGDLAKRIRCRGDINYCICRLVLESMKPEAGWSYQSLSDAVASIEAAASEMYNRFIEPLDDDERDGLCSLYDAAREISRRLLDPYEDQAILNNGDMACFQEFFAHYPKAPPSRHSGCGCRCKPPSVAEAACDVTIEEAAQEVSGKIEQDIEEIKRKQ